MQTCAGLYKKRGMRNVRKRRVQDKQNYLRNKESKRQASRNNYWKNPDKQRASSWAYSLTSYWKNPDKSRASSRASSHTRYWEDPDKSNTPSIYRTNTITLQEFLYQLYLISQVMSYVPATHHTQPTHTCTPCISIETVPWGTHNMQCYNPVIQENRSYSHVYTVP